MFQPKHALTSGAKVLLPLAAVGIGGCGGRAEKPQRPNILLIMTDDHTIQALSCYGGCLVETPNLDRLAEEGMLFENCYVPNAISGPSRACILTGKYSHRNGFTDNSQTFDGSQQTFPKLLHEAGYQTAVVGKWHLNSDPQGFDYWNILVGQGEYYAPRFIDNGREVTEGGYVTDIITDKAIGFLNNRDKSRPFMMLCYHKAPHRNWMPAQRHLGMFENHTFPEPYNLLDDYSGRGDAAREQAMEIGRDMWDEWDLKLAAAEESEPVSAISEAEPVADPNKADVARANDRAQSIRQLRDAFDRMTPAEKKAWDRAYAPRMAEWRKIRSTASKEDILRWKYQQYMKDYCAVVKAVDENVGRLIDYLKKNGLYDNTIIVYTSDQGFYLGEHGWFDKRFMYEESFRTPLLVRYPSSVGSGVHTKALSMNIDLAPTFLDYAGVKIPKDIQGRSLRPVLDGGGKAPSGWRDAVYYHYYEYPSWHSVKRHYGIRTADYKLIHFYNDIDQWELYDMKQDPHEMHNVYYNPDYSAVRERMHKRLEQLQSECGDTDPDETVSEFFHSADKLK